MYYEHAKRQLNLIRTTMLARKYELIKNIIIILTPLVTHIGGWVDAKL